MPAFPSPGAAFGEHGQHALRSVSSCSVEGLHQLGFQVREAHPACTVHLGDVYGAREIADRNYGGAAVGQIGSLDCPDVAVEHAQLQHLQV